MLTIQTAAALIREIDPALAQAFLDKPFQRHNLITAFHRSLAKSSTYAAKADEIAVQLRSATDTAERIRVSCELVDGKNYNRISNPDGI